MRTTGVSALAVAAALCASAGGASAQEPIRGQGATLPAGLYADWFNPSPVSDFAFSYNAARGGTAALTGSSAGKASFESHSFNNLGADLDVQFAGSDAILRESDLDAYESNRWGQPIQFPAVGTPITIAYNQGSLNLSRRGRTGLVAADGTQSNGPALFLSRASYCGIFTGGITNWNDARIRADNNGVAPSNQPITVVVRSDGSGTTEIFTRHLDTVCNGSQAAGGFSFPDTRRAADQSDPSAPPPGRTGGLTATGDSIVDWDAIITPASRLVRGAGNGGVSTAIASTDFAIGYLSPDFTNLVSPTAPGAGSPAPATAILQNQNDIDNGRVKFGRAATYRNSQVAQLTVPAPKITDGAIRWGEKLSLRQGGSTPTINDERNNPTSREAYPINGFTFLDFYTCYPRSKVAGVKGLISYYTTRAGNADDEAKKAGFAPLRGGIKNVIRARANSDAAPRGIIRGPRQGVCTL